MAREEAGRQLEVYAEELRRRGSTVQSVVRVARRPASEILRVADELKVERIVMASRGRRGLSRLLLGNTAEAVRRADSCPVDVLPTSQWSSSDCPESSCTFCAFGGTKADEQLKADLDG